MLSKLSRVLGSKKSDGDEPVFPINYYSPGLPRMGTKPAAMSSQPNLTVFHSTSMKDKYHDFDDNDDHDNNSPPPSPSKRSFRNIFKRSSRLQFDMQHPGGASSQMSLPLPKKKRGAVLPDTFEPPDEVSEDNSKPNLTNQHNSTVVSGDSKQSIRSILRTADHSGNHARNMSTVSKGTTSSVRFFSRDAYRDEESPEIYSKSPTMLNHSRSTTSLHMEPVEEEFGVTPRPVRYSQSRGDTVSLLDKLRNEGKMESPSNTLTFADQQDQHGEEGMADPFSGERDAPSVIPFPGDDGPRPSMESSRSSLKSSSTRSHKVTNSQESFHQTNSHFDIPTSMSNLLDSYPGELEEPLLPHISMSDGLFAELREEMKEVDWIPPKALEAEVPEADFFSGMGASASNAATLRQRSFTLPSNASEDARPIFNQSLAQSSPAMSRILREESVFSPKANERSSAEPPRTPAHVPQDVTQFFTPHSAPAHNSTFSPIDHRRSSSNPVTSGGKRSDPTPAQVINASDLFGTEDALVQSLRSQLLVQTSLVEHLEGELVASQTLVNSLSERYRKARETAGYYKDEESKHKGNLSKLKRKCQELEGMIEEANGERSQRSMLDECTADAMRVLQERCLEAEEKCKREIHSRKTLESELSQLQDCLDSFNATQHSLCLPELDGEELESLKARVGQLQVAEEQRKALEDELEMLRVENEQLQERLDRVADDSPAPAPKTQRKSAMELHSVEVTELREIIRHTSEELDELKTKYDEDIAARDSRIDELRQEVEMQWSRTESGQEMIEKFMAALQEKENQLEEMQEYNERNERMENDYNALVTRCQEMEEEWQLSEKEKQDLFSEFTEATDIKYQLENERNAIELELRREKSEVDRLARALEELQTDLHQLDEERRFAVDDAERLKQNLVMREEVISSDSKKMANLVLEKDELANEVVRVRKENARLHEANQRQGDELAAREHELQAEREALARDKAEVDITRENVDSRVGALEEDLRRAQKVITEMKARSADTEVEILQLQKTRAKEREDKEGLEIALQAKQQELEMIKRKLNVRGATEGASRVISRRESFAPSSLSGTPMGPPARPSSVLSVASSTASTRKEATSSKLGPRNPLSSRSNVDSSDAAATPVAPASQKRARFTDNTTSPPSSAMAARRLSVGSTSSLASVVGTTGIKSPTSSTPLTRTNSRSSLALKKSSLDSTPTAVSRKTSGDMATPRPSLRTTSSTIKTMRRQSSTLSPPQEEKENKAPTSVSVRRRVAAMEGP